MPLSPSSAWNHRASLMLIGLMMLVPFVQPIHMQPIASFHSEMAAVVLGLLAAGVLFAKTQAAFAVPRIAAVPATLIVTIVVQWLAGRIEFAEVALLDILFLLWAALLACVGATLRREVGVAALAAAMSWALVIGGLISALVAVIQFLHGPAPAWLIFSDRIPATNLGQRNHAADYLWLAIAAAISLRLRNAMSAGTGGAVLVALVLAAALTGSRGPLVYGTLLVMLGTWWWRQEHAPTARMAVVLAVATTLGFLVASGLVKVLPGVGLGDNAAIDRLAFATLAGDPRLTIWQDAWHIFLETPWLGCGAGNYPWRSFEVASQLPHGLLALPAEHAHNLVLQSLAEYGAIATLAATAILAGWLRDALRHRFDATHWWLLAGVAIIGGHSLLEYPLWYAYFLGPFALLLGAGDERAVVVQPTRGRAIYALATFLAALAIFNLWRDERRIEASVYRPSGEATVGLIAVAKGSLLAPLARHGVALAMMPKMELAADQAKLCAVGLRFRPRPDLANKCGLLQDMLGNRSAAADLYHRGNRVWPGATASAENP